MEDINILELKCNKCGQMLGYMNSKYPISSRTGTVNKITIFASSRDQAADELVFLCKDCYKFHDEFK